MSVEQYKKLQSDPIMQLKLSAPKSKQVTTVKSPIEPMPTMAKNYSDFYKEHGTLNNVLSTPKVSKSVVSAPKRLPNTIPYFDKDDSALTAKQRIEKYQAISKDMSIPNDVRNKAVKQGQNTLNDVARQSISLGFLRPKISGVTSTDEIKTAMALRDELARQTTGGAASIGFMNSASFGTLKNLGDKERKQEIKRSEDSHPIAYGAGSLAGEAVKYAGTAKLVESIPIVSKAVQGAGAGISRMLGGKISADVASRLLMGRATDLPVDIVNAAQEAENPQEFASRLAKDTALGFATDVGFETIGKLWRLGKAARAEKQAVKQFANDEIAKGKAITETFKPQKRELSKDIAEKIGVEHAKKQYTSDLMGTVYNNSFDSIRSVRDSNFKDIKKLQNNNSQILKETMPKPLSKPVTAPTLNNAMSNSKPLMKPQTFEERAKAAEEKAYLNLQSAIAEKVNKFAEFNGTDAKNRRPELYDELVSAQDNLEKAQVKYDDFLKKKSEYETRIKKADELEKISGKLKHQTIRHEDIDFLKKQIGASKSPEDYGKLHDLKLTLFDIENQENKINSLRHMQQQTDEISKVIELQKQIKETEQLRAVSVKQLKEMQNSQITRLEETQNKLRGAFKKPVSQMPDISDIKSINKNQLKIEQLKGSAKNKEPEPNRLIEGTNSHTSTSIRPDSDISIAPANDNVKNKYNPIQPLPVLKKSTIKVDDFPVLNNRSDNGRVSVLKDFSNDIEPTKTAAKAQALGGEFEAKQRETLSLKNASESDPRKLEEAAKLVEQIDYDSDTIIPSNIAWQIDDVNGAYNKDIARVLDAAGKGSAKVRGFLQKNILNPLMQAKSNYAHNVKNTLNKYYNDMKQLGIRAGSTESAAVQWFGEGYKRDKNGKAIEYTLEQLKRDFPDRWQNITKADGINRKLYDDYVDRLNAELERIYPNVEEKAQKDLLNFKAKAQVFQKQFSELKQGIEASSGELKTKFEKQMKTLMGSIQENDKEIIKLQREIESGEIFRNKRIFKRKDYYHHWQEMDNGLSAIRNIFDMPSEIAPGLVGVSDFTKPKSKWAGFMQRREGLDSVEDSVGGMLRYIQGAEYKINIDPQIARLRVAVRDLQEGTADTRNANKFIEWLTDYTNDLAGKTNPFDRAKQKEFSRKTIKALKWINNRVKANAVMGNASSVVSQIYNLPNVVGYIKNPVDLASGMKETVKLSFGDKQAKSAIGQSGFITERYLSNTLNKFDESIIKIPEKFLGWFMEIGDRKVAEMSWFSAYQQAQRKGISNPVSYADDITRRAIAGRGIGEIPLTQKSEVVKLFAPFQIEVNNSYQILKEKLGQKDALGIISIFGTTWLLNQIRKNYIDGRETGMDMIGAGQDAYKEITTGDSKDDTAFGKAMTVAGRLGGEVLSNVPMGDQFVNTVLGLDSNYTKKIFGEGDPTRFGTGNIGISALSKPAANLFIAGKPVDYLEPVANIGLPYGGAQVTRSRKALEDLNIIPKARYTGGEGFTAKKQDTAGAYTEDNKRLKYPLDSSDVRNAATGVLFGSLSTNEGKKYLNDGAKMLSETATGQFNDAVKSEIEPFPVFDTIKKFQKIEPIRDQNGDVIQSEPLQKRKDIMLMDLPDFKKTRLDQLLVAGKDKDTGEYKRTADYSSDGAFLASTALNESSFEKAQKAYEMGVPYENFVKVHDVLKPLSKAKSAEKRRAIAELDIPAKQKNIIDDFLINDITIIPKDVKADYSSNETLDISTSSEAAQRKWNYAKKAGFSSEEFKGAWGIMGDYKKKSDRIHALVKEGYNSSDAKFFEKLYSVKLK